MSQAIHGQVGRQCCFIASNSSILMQLSRDKPRYFLSGSVCLKQPGRLPLFRYSGGSCVLCHMTIVTSTRFTTACSVASSCPSCSIFTHLASRFAGSGSVTARSSNDFTPVHSHRRRRLRHRARKEQDQWAFLQSACVSDVTGCM